MLGRCPDFNAGFTTTTIGKFLPSQVHDHQANRQQPEPTVQVMVFQDHVQT